MKSLRVPEPKRLAIAASAFSFSKRSSAAAVIAGFAVGMAEGAYNGAGLYGAITGSAFLGIFLIPIGFAASIAIRLLWRGWQPHNLIKHTRQPSGACPTLAAWALVALAIISFVSLATHLALAEIVSKTRTPVVITVSATLTVGLLMTISIVISRPLARLVEAGFKAAIGRWPQGARWLSPRAIAIFLFTAITILVGFSWFVLLEPQLGHLDITPVYYLVALAVLLLAIHVALDRFAKSEPSTTTWWRPSILLATSVVLVAMTALHARYRNTDMILSVWGNQPLAGRAIDSIFDLRKLHAARNRAAIKPRELFPGHPDILLITIDTMRADHTRPYGGSVVMPTLEKLADSGTVFDWAFSSGNVTRRSLATLATGLSPHRVKGRITGWSLKLDPRHISIAERLRAAGYDTAGFAWSEAFFGSDRFGGGLDYTEFSDRGADDLANRARKWIRARRQKQTRQKQTSSITPLFVWIHFIDPHRWKQSKQKPPAKLSLLERNYWLYDRSLRHIDRALKIVVDPPTKTLNPFGRIIAVTSDHGEGLGEHGNAYHSTDLYNSQIRVPLIISGQGVAKGRIVQPVGLVDLGPTLMELAGYHPITMPSADGVSLAKLIVGTASDSPDGGMAHASMVRDRSVPTRVDAIVIGTHKYIDYATTRPSELYDLRNDPNEAENIITTHPEIAKRLHQALDTRRSLEKISPF